MGFSIGVITDILKFPYPLFPRYKNVYPVGFRFVIPPLAQSNEFTISLPTNNKFELQSITFSTSGYKDGDKFSIIKNSQYVVKDCYTKELGQTKEIRPIVKIESDTDVLKFVFDNTTGTSKVVWVDLDMTAVKAVLK